MTGKFEITRLPLEDACVIQAFEFRDERGLFLKFYEEKTLASANIKHFFCEEFLSVSRIGTVRGLHYLSGMHSDAKLVTCLKGRTYDVIVDLRRKSPTFGKWHGILMQGEKPATLYIPPGFAHGFLALAEDTTILYRTGLPYKPEMQRGIIWNDKTLAIKWPLNGEPILSEADQKWPDFEHAEKFD